MERVTVFKKNLYADASASKGTQPKYRISDNWYKEDLFGGEGLNEYLISLVLSYSTLPRDCYTLYKQCEIYKPEYDTKTLGCVSKDFTNRGSRQFITISDLYSKFSKTESLGTKLKSLDTGYAKAEYIVNFCSRYLHYDITQYFSRIFTLDYISLNVDRHLRNIGLFYYRGGQVGDAVIFDNGLSLFTGALNLNTKDDYQTNISKVRSKPFSYSFSKQMQMFGKAFNIDYIGLFRVLKTLPDSKNKLVLINRLFEVYNLFSDIKTVALVYNNSQIGTAISSAGRVYNTELKLPSNNHITCNVTASGFVIIPPPYKGTDISPELIQAVLNKDIEYFSRGK